MAAALCLIAISLFAQHVPDAKVPSAVRSALTAKYPNAKGVTVTFTPDGSFVELVVATPVSSLPPAITAYVKGHYIKSTITEAGKITWPGGKTGYEAEVKGKDLVFDEKGNFIRID